MLPEPVSSSSLDFDGENPDRIRARSYRRRSNALIALALLANMAWLILAMQESLALQFLSGLVALAALPLWTAGLALYARAKRRSGWWAVAGFFGLFGLILLALLPDLYRPQGQKMRASQKIIIGLVLVMVMSALTETRAEPDSPAANPLPTAPGSIEASRA